MQLKTIRYKNWCQFEDKTIEFSPGLNLLIGPNGSGKSNSLKGIFAATTGSTSRNDGPQADNVTQSAAKNVHSFIEMDFTHAGLDIRTTKSIRPSKRSITINGVTTEGDKQVQKLLYDTLGVDEELFGNYVMVDQWELFSIFRMPPAQRAAAIQRLFRLDRAAVLHSLLGDKLTELPEVPLTADDLPQRRQQLESRLAETQAELATQLGVSDEDIVKTNDRMRLASAAAAARAKLPGLLTEKQQREQEELNASQQLSSVTRSNEDLCVRVASLREQHAAIVDAANQWSTYTTQCAAVEQTRSRRRSIINDMQVAVVPQRPERYVAPEARPQMEQMIRDSDIEVGIAQTQLTNFDPKKNLTSCPTCGTAVTSLQGHLDECRTKVTNLQPVVAALRLSLSESQTYDHQLAKYTSEQATRQKLLDQLPEPSDPVAPAMAAPTQVQVQAVRSECQSAEQLQNAATQNISKYTQALGAAKSFLTSLQATIQQVEKDAALSLEDASELSRQLEQLTSAKAIRSATLRRVSELEQDLAVVVAAERQAEEHRQKRELVEARRQKLTQQRQLFHHQAIPKILAAQMIHGLTAATNEYAREFGSPFRLSALEDGGFVVNFPDGKGVRPTRLSGGQGIVLALAFRLATNSTYASHLGLLCLDEPTVGLDAANLKGLIKALERLRTLASTTGLQVIVVSHEKEIANQFDRVIEL